jgi:hypothetical protein
MNALIKKLGIDETYTKPTKKPVFDKVKQNTYPVGGYNYMADVLFLPETKEKYKYLLCMVDLWSDEFDMEPLKTKEPTEVLDAMQKIFKRKYLKKPKASIRTDNGSEFKGVFHKWLYENNILHREALPFRHQQLANVELINYYLGRLLNGYMNKIEEQTGKVYKEWTDILSTIRKDLNEVRKKEDGNPYNEIMTPPTDKMPKYKEGDLVYYKLERPMNALGYYQNTTNFRAGDYRFDTKNPRKIKQVLYYPKNIRYILNGMLNVSFAESELLPAKQKEETYTVKKIIDKKTENKIVYYKIWWNKYKKADATWEPRTELIKDGLKPLLDEYDKNN